MDTQRFNENQIEEAAVLLRKGEVVAFPTETVYGLGGDATNPEAVKKIFSAKGRPGDNPLISHVWKKNQVDEYAEEISDKARSLMDVFWPGPLTLILKARKEGIASNVTAGLPSVSFRMPDNALALELIRRVGKPLAAPSANTSGKPSPTTAEHVWRDLDGRIAGVIEGGATMVGLESTVLDITHPEDPVILRPGAITKEQIEKVIGPVNQHTPPLTDKDAPKSPGMKYQHYSPKEPVYIVSREGMGWNKAIDFFQSMGECVGVLANDFILNQLQEKSVVVYSLGSTSDAKEASKHLYSGLRYFEDTNATVILAEELPATESGLAFMNRLDKAAGSKKI